MKFKIFIVVMFSMLMGACIDGVTTGLYKNYDKRISSEIFGNKISKEEYLKNPYDALDKAIKSTNVKEDMENYSKRLHIFAYSMFVIKTFLWLLVSYWFSLLIIRITHNNSLKAQPSAAGTSPTGAASQHSAGGSAP